MHQALYRKWRPTTFDEVCGQEHITTILKYQCRTGKVSHAYLFCGTRGTGKTSCSKILAKAINCLEPVDGNPCGKCAACRAIDSGAAMDVIEMDAASNNGIDNIRDIRDEVVYTPSELKYRVYIIDEVHMLSISAFNALLKTLEEPPSYVVFILATTEMHKLPATIVSRCQRYDFRKLPSSVICARLSYIAEQEKISLTEDGAALLASLAAGGMRDAISLFELCCGTGKVIDAPLVRDMLGLCGRDVLASLVEAVKSKNYESIFETVAEAENGGRDLSVFWQDIIGYYRDMLVVRTVRHPEAYLDLGEGELVSLRRSAEGFTAAELIRQSKILDAAFALMQKAGGSKRNIAEMTLIRLCDSTLDLSADALLSRIAELESRVMALYGKGEMPLPEMSERNPDEDAPRVHSSEDAASSVSVPLSVPVAQTAVPAEMTVPSSDKQKPDIPPEPEFSVSRADPAERLTSLKYWDDVIESVRNASAATKGFIDNTEGFRREGKNEFVIRVPSKAAETMLNRERARNAIASAISFYEKAHISDAQLEFVCDETMKKKTSPLDELG